MRYFTVLLNVILLTIIIYFTIKEGLPEFKDEGIIVYFLFITFIFNIIFLLSGGKKIDKGNKFKSLNFKKIGISLVLFGILSPIAIFPLTFYEDEYDTYRKYISQSSEFDFRSLRIYIPIIWDDYIEYRYILFLAALSFSAGCVLLARERYFLHEKADKDTTS